jgi:hypothetical protein
MPVPRTPTTWKSRTSPPRFRIFDRFESQQEFLLYNSALDAAADAVTTAGDGFTSLQQILTTLPAQYFALSGANLPAITAAGLLGIDTTGTTHGRAVSGCTSCDGSKFDSCRAA